VQRLGSFSQWPRQRFGAPILQVCAVEKLLLDALLKHGACII